MIIRYAGSKPKKVVNYSGKEITFAPCAEFNEVFDLPLIKWLLNPDKLGLFVVEENKDSSPSVTHPELTPQKEEAAATEPEQSTESKQKTEEEIEAEKEVEQQFKKKQQSKRKKRK